MIMYSETTPAERNDMKKYGHIVMSGEKPEPNINQLADDIKTLVSVSVKASRWALVHGYWTVGQQIRMEISSEWQKGNGSCLSDLSNKSGIGERTLYRCIQVYEQYPDINSLPEGDNISWNKLITKYLGGNEEAKQLKDTFEKPGEWFEELFTKAEATKTGRVTFERNGKKWRLELVVEKVPSENGAQINQLIELFEPINPSFERLFKLPSERAAMERLLVKYGFERTKEMVIGLREIYTDKFAPRATTPFKLEEKLGDIISHIKKKGEDGTKFVKIS